MLSVGAQSMLQIRIKKINVDPDPKKMSYYQTFVPLINIQQTNKHLKKTMYIVKYDLLYLFFVNFLYIQPNDQNRTRIQHNNSVRGQIRICNTEKNRMHIKL